LKRFESGLGLKWGGFGWQASLERLEALKPLGSSNLVEEVDSLAFSLLGSE
jgi:hypothetical protein